jgi:hypothetical protein
MAIPELVFHCFGRLPLELREEIWRYCLPFRVCEMDFPVDEIVFDLPGDDEPPPCTLSDTTRANSCPPLICRVCRESRSVAFRAANIPTGFAQDRPRNAQWVSTTSTRRTWQDFTRGSPHLNWTPIYEMQYQSSGSPLHSLAWAALHMSGTGSLMVEHLDPDFGDPNTYLDTTYDASEPYMTRLRSPITNKDLEALEQLPHCLVIMRTIVIHSDVESAVTTGLFGLLGDARVQIVDVSREALVNAFFKLAEACEREHFVTVNQNFHRQPATSMRQQLRNLIMSIFDSKKLVMAMHPAIMFRLCTKMCNHRVDE